MSLAELLPAIRALPRSERVKLIHLLLDDVTEGTPRDATMLAALFPAGAVFDIATPVDCYETAAALQGLLDAEKSRP